MAPALLTIRACLGLNLNFSVALAVSFCVFLLRGSSTFLSKCTKIRCVTCVSMRLDLPGHFVLWFHGMRRLTLSPTSYTGRARSSIEKKVKCFNKAGLVVRVGAVWHLFLGNFGNLRGWLVEFLIFSWMFSLGGASVHVPQVLKKSGDDRCATRESLTCFRGAVNNSWSVLHQRESNNVLFHA